MECLHVELTLLKLKKGQGPQIFECWFFHQLASPGPIRGTLGRFQILPNIHRDI